MLPSALPPIRPSLIPPSPNLPFRFLVSLLLCESIKLMAYCIIAFRREWQTARQCQKGSSYKCNQCWFKTLVHQLQYMMYVSLQVFSRSALQMKGRRESILLSGSHSCFPWNETVISKTELCGSGSQFLHSCICARFIFPGSVCLFCCSHIERLILGSQTHDCGNWDWGRTIPRKSIHNWDFLCSVGWIH